MLKFDEYNNYKKTLERAVTVPLQVKLDESAAVVSGDSMGDDEMMKEAQSKVDLAISKIMIKFKFFGEFIHRLRIVYTYRVNTMATDGKNIFISPKFCKTLTTTEVMFVLVHEVLHNVMSHFVRESALLGGNPSGEQHEQWNIAADYEINLIAIDALVDPKSGEPLITIDHLRNKMKGYVDAKYEGIAAEVIYRENPGGKQQPGDNQLPAEVGDYIRLKDGTFGVITGIDANGDFDIDPIDENTINNIFGL